VSLVDRIWARDPSVWTSSGEERWLGWLDAPVAGRALVPELERFAERAAADGLAEVVLLGMGGSSLAPEVLRRAFDAERFHVLDTTHPAAIRRLARSLDPERTLVLVSSKSGTTIETRMQLEYFWRWARADGRCFAAITDPGSELERLARERRFRATFAGEPTIGGRYSALSPFGLVPAALVGVELEPFLARAAEMAKVCRGAEDNPGLELGNALGEGWRAGRDKVCLAAPFGFGLWVEQLLAESTGKDGKGLVPALGEAPEGPDRQGHEVRLDDPYDLAREFFRWEFATAVAGHHLGINPFDQPDVQAAKDATARVLAAGGEPDVSPRGSLDELLAGAREGDYVAIQAFVDPAREEELAPLVERARATGCVVTVGLGPRYLHSTGQLHKGGPNTVLCVQVVDDPGDELHVPGGELGFRRLLRAQAAGDLAALDERGRRVVRVRLEEV
jgi:hypothetical protein